MEGATTRVRTAIIKCARIFFPWPSEIEVAYRYCNCSNELRTRLANNARFGRLACNDARLNNRQYVDGA